MGKIGLRRGDACLLLQWTRQVGEGWWLGSVWLICRLTQLDLDAASRHVVMRSKSLAGRAFSCRAQEDA